ncbi:GAS2-like protein 2 [Sceloporus undulatus]|uniref:GAS2-like protein 2 n=1 Tax=Sceloporus undulatus TaxID=8520 RepID=UPI001C4BC70E|nr:GAS2-like protein 2 [Sceloporus undulatus]
MTSRIPEARMRSIRPFKTGEQYLFAMKEDLAEWLEDLYGLGICAGSFLEALETGVWLCHHANCVAQVAKDFAQQYPNLSARIRVPKRGVACCNDMAQPGTFQARDNVSNFIQWCRKEMDIKEVLMFETEDLVLRKNEKNFVLCLLEVARRASRFGMKAPTLVRMEEEIEEEIRRDLNLPPDETPLPKPQREPTHFRNLDQMVRHLVSRCTCPVQFSMVKVSEGKYRVGDSSALIFVRILRKHVMVRVGGGWDTLEHYLDKHDPCRCTSLSHKQAMRMSSPQRTQAAHVQHEIMARLTPRTDHPHKPQPALIVSRSQSPLAPVEWRTYVPHGAGRKAPAVPSSDSIGADGSKKMAAVATSRDQSEPRRAPSSTRPRERSATPSGRWTTAEERRPGLEQEIFTRGPSNTFHGSISNGNTGEDLSSSKCPLGPQNRPRAGSLPTVAREKDKSPVPPGQRAGTSQLPGSSRPEGNGCLLTCPSSPAKPLQQVTMALSGQERVGWRKGSAAQRSPSPVKNNTCQAHKMDAGKVGWTSCRPPTPSKSPRWLFRDGGDAAAGDQEPKEEAAPTKEPGKIGPTEACGGRLPGHSGVGADRMDSGRERKSGQPCLRPAPKCFGDTKERMMAKERVYTPLPLNRAEERALYQSLEEEIMANVKELEADFDDKDIPRSGGFRMTKDPVLGRNSPRLSMSTSPFPEGHKQVLGFGEGVPRSGVYVPERETRWCPGGACYEDVIRELSMALRREETEAVRCLPPLGNGTQVDKKVPESKVPQEEKRVTPENVERSTTTTHKVCEEVNGDCSQAATNSSESFASPEEEEEEAKLPPDKPKRSLKKPERVPSIYKLKLRPKIRPRRDNRPEKRPSKIPRPVSYCCGPKSSGAKGRPKAHSPKGPGVGQNSLGKTRAREEAFQDKVSYCCVPEPTVA